MYRPKNSTTGNAFEVMLRQACGQAETDDVEVWPENWDAVALFSRLSTQWRVGMSGPTGLDYAAVYPLIDRQAQTRDEWERLFDDLQVLEHEALEALGEANV